MANERLVTINSCARCDTGFAIPEDLYRAAKHSEEISFCCPYGHSNIFKQGETDVERLRRAHQRMVQENARLAEERDEARRKTAAAKGQVTRLKNRAKAGVCPCCNRHFDNLQRHMETKHPDGE